MDRVEAPPLSSPHEGLGHKVGAIPAWLGRHWKALSLAVAATLGAGYLSITHDRGPQTPPQSTTPASDTLPDPGIGVLIPTIIPTTEVPPPTVTPTPAATATKESTPTFIPPTKTPEPTTTSTPEKKLYPDYGVSSGIATTVDGKTKRGMVMISYLPSPVGKWCVYYFLQGASRRGETAYLFTLNKTGINSFESAEKRYDKIQVSIGENGSLSGTIDWGGGEERFAFQLSLQGTGKRIFLDGYKRIKISEQVPGGTIPDQQAIDWLAKSGITLP